MSLPPGFLDELRSRLSLGQVVGRKVMWDRRKTNEAKGDLWAPCPFHQEKTASFHVDDRKGFYYCFGCHAKGDAITFVRETENVDFMEAVKILAGEAGMPLPERDPRAQEKADHRTRLSEVMEEAVKHYRLALRTGAASEARAYLERRGLDAQAQARWELGFGGAERNGLFRALTAKGIEARLLVEAGLCAEPDGGGEPYDRFRNRILFPIRDARGRAIAFGGRAMDPNARAKYLNSPETALFDKSATLYNLHQARAAAGRDSPLIVAEGYMDVIALSEAGFPAAVAPLGTAVTEGQLRLLWRLHPEPVVALDGDTAGQRAAGRVIDLALPLIEAGQSLRFALMPPGKDPDDLLRAEGPEAMRKVIGQAEPMVSVLWRRETEGAVLDSPERRAALDRRLREVIGRIRDPSLRRHYGEEIAGLRRALFRPKGWSEGQRPWRQKPQAVARPTTRASALAAGGGEDRLREAAILATLIVTPELLPEFEAELETMDCADPDHARLRDAMLAHDGAAPLRETLERSVGPAILEKLFAERHVAVTPAIRRPGDAEMARLSLAEELAKLRARRGHARAIDEAMEDIGGLADEWLTRRLEQAAAAVDVTRRRETKDERETVTAPNGVALDKEERQSLDRLLEAIDFARAGRKRRT